MKETLGLPDHLEGQVWLVDGPMKGLYPHRHDELEFNLVIAGTGRYLLHGRCYSLYPSSLVWLFPEQMHVLIKTSADFKMWVAVFKVDMVQSFCRLLPSSAMLAERDPAGGGCRILSRHDTEATAAQCAEIQTEQVPELNRAGLLWLLRSVWIRWQKATVESRFDDIHPAVEKAVRCLREDNSLSLTLLARRAGLSPSHLSRRFHREMGTTLSAFRNQCRLQRFHALYGSGRRRTILDCALESGFGSYEQFRRVYKQSAGVEYNIGCE